MGVRLLAIQLIPARWLVQLELLLPGRSPWRNIAEEAVSGGYVYLVAAFRARGELVGCRVAAPETGKVALVERASVLI